MNVNVNDIANNFLLFIGNKAHIVENLFKTLVLLVILLFIKAIVTKNINSWKGLANDDRRRFVVNVRNFTVFAFLFGLLFIWGYQIKEFAFSVAAFAIAFVMSFKEVITNFTGGISRTISHPFAVGDRIIVGNFRGDVIDTNMLTTTILEIGPGKDSHQYTGSSISIPNTVLLNTPVTNESYMGEYVLHIFHVILKRTEDWHKAEKYLLEASKIVCAPYLNKARMHMERTARKSSVEAPTADPRVLILLNNPDVIDLLVRVPVPAKRKGRIEQEIIRRYLNMMDDNSSLPVLHGDKEL